MKIQFLGGSDEVGASCVLLEMGGQRILVDAGIRVSPKARDGLTGEMLPDLAPLTPDLSKDYNQAERSALDAIIITHAHADHIGAIPLVVGSMPDVPVYTTPATISIMSVMFRDSLRIMESRLEAEGELPSFDLLQVQQVENACRPTDIRTEFTVNGAVNVTFYRAGHIPGAVSVFLQSDDGSVLVSGDLSFSPMRATPMAEIPPVQPDALILESTYGGKLHSNRRAEEARLVESVSEVIEKGGRVLIPAFALGRAQEVALILDAAIAKNKLQRVPIYMDGMTRSITKVFERFPDYLSKELYEHLEDSLDLFRSGAVHFIRHTQERSEVAVTKKPSVVISSSGMLTGGASPVYAAEIVKEEDSAIFITGYQDEESPGRALQNLASHEADTIILNGKKHKVRCHVGTYSLSAHADENELTQFATQLKPVRTFLVHGDGMARERMRDLIMMRKINVRLPKLGEVVEFAGSTPVAPRKRDVPEVPKVVVPPIKTLEELDLNLPLFDAEGQLYVRNAKKAIRKLLPPETGLRKISFNKSDRTIKFNFDFPEVAAKKYSEQLEMVRQMTGWEVTTNDSVNMMALNSVAKEMIPTMVGRASIHMAEAVVEIKVTERPENWKELQEEYYKITGFRLLTKGNRQSHPSTTAQVERINPSNEDQLEINEAYGVLKSELRDYGLYKTGLKGGVIVLSFITPEKGLAIRERLEELSEKVGYPLDIHPHPNQHAIISLVSELCDSYGVFLVKNPSLMINNQMAVIEPHEEIPSDVAAELQGQFSEYTGWSLRIKVAETT